MILQVWLFFILIGSNSNNYNVSSTGLTGSNTNIGYPSYENDENFKKVREEEERIMGLLSDKAVWYLLLFRIKSMKISKKEDKQAGNSYNNSYLKKNKKTLNVNNKT